MIVLTLSACPPGIRGDVTKWLLEVSTGVYVGQLNARVRDALWKRICDHMKTGHATMVYSTRNEQGFSYYVHNTAWSPVDFDGIMLMKRPLPAEKTKSEDSFSHKSLPASKQTLSSKTVMRTSSQQTVSNAVSCAAKSPHQTEPLPYMPWPMNQPLPSSFTALDLETTGLDVGKDRIIEIAALRFRAWQEVESFQCLVQNDGKIPAVIVKLTGITDEMVIREGLPLEDALYQLFTFLSGDTLVGHNIIFDLEFLKFACLQKKIPFPDLYAIDTLIIARSVLPTEVPNYRLETLANHFSLAEKQQHRALPDAYLTGQLLLKLNEISKTAK